MAVDDHVPEDELSAGLWEKLELEVLDVLLEYGQLDDDEAEAADEVDLRHLDYQTEVAALEVR